MTGQNLVAALQYASMGWQVFPIKPKDKIPLTPHGFKDATTDEACITQWWGQWPEANIGIATGSQSGLVALDVDTDKDGDASLTSLEKRFGLLPNTLKQRTGGGGFHCLFRHPGHQVRNSAGTLGPGLDLRGDGGYIVVPPSIHASGQPYEWLAPISDLVPAPLPPWLSSRQVPLRLEPGQEDVIPQGRRNDTLFRHGMRLRGILAAQGIENDLQIKNSLQCKPPLSEEEVASIAVSVSRYEPAHSFTESPVSSEPTDSESPPWRCSIDLVHDAPEETEWLIQDVVPAESSVLTVAREGTYKTWLSLDFAKAVAEGIPWLGHDCQAGGVLYLDAENPGPNFRQRLHAVGASLNLHIWRWQDPSFPISLSDPWLKAAAKRFRLIVIDTLKRFTGNRDENNADDMAEVTQQLRELTRYGATVLVLHHATKDKDSPGYRGSTELGAGVDVVYFIGLSKKGPEKLLTVSATKNRYLADKNLVLKVQDGLSKPVFHLADTFQAPSEVALSSELDQLAAVISELTQTLVRQPNQSEIVERAKEKHEKSRPAVLRGLFQGQGSRWQSSLDGRSRLYELLPYCPPVQPCRGGIEQNTFLAGSSILTDLSSPGDIEADKGNNEQMWCPAEGNELP
jgi:hypothetical protein